MKAGIITFHRAQNLGAVLQAYAFCTYLNNNICETEIIDYYPNNTIYTKNNIVWSAYRALKGVIGGRKSRNQQLLKSKFNEFMSYYRMSESHYYGDVAIMAKPPSYNVIISGSDQILNTTLTGDSEAFYLSFAPDTPKISYASSFGRNDVTEMEKHLVRKYLINFEALSVRESSGADIINKEIGIRPQLVVDPVFLLSPEDWIRMSAKREARQYIFVYAMENTLALFNAVEAVRKQLGLPVIIVPGTSSSLPIAGELDLSCGPREFLGYLQNAACVVTNSFHGSAFSIIFGKMLVCVAHSKRNTRLENLMDLLEARNRMVMNDTSIDNIEDILVYARYNGRIQELIANSKHYLLENVRKHE